MVPSEASTSMLLFPPFLCLLSQTAYLLRGVSSHSLCTRAVTSQWPSSLPCRFLSTPLHKHCRRVGLEDLCVNVRHQMPLLVLFSRFGIHPFYVPTHTPPFSGQLSSFFFPLFTHFSPPLLCISSVCGRSMGKHSAKASALSFLFFLVSAACVDTLGCTGAQLRLCYPTSPLSTRFSSLAVPHFIHFSPFHSISLICIHVNGESQRRGEVPQLE